MIERFVAGRYLKIRKNSGFAYVVTWFSFIGIALGVATLIIVTSVMNGFRHELLGKIVGMKGHIVVTNLSPEPLKNYDKLSQSIAAADNCITLAIPMIEQQAVLLADSNARGIIVHGISQADLKSKPLISCNIVRGNIENFSGQTVFIGRRLAENLGKKQSDKIKLLIPNALITPFGNLPKEETFEISGIFEVGMNEYDKNIIIMPLDTAQDFFSLKNAANQIEIYVDDIDNSQKLTKILAKKLGNNYRILDWRHSDASIFHAVVVEKNVMTLILSIIVLVAVFNIISGLTMLTNNKTRDIAILRTMGATKKSILKIFFYIGAAIGISGTFLGVTLGLLVTLNIDKIKHFLEKFSNSELFSEEIYFLTHIPSKTDVWEVFWIVFLSIILCFFATIYPARKAAKLDPVEALRS
ncbi:ABC transporter permease [Alphaproteobacteria bacterium]|nr:ABC transporter permease [Alphaproteobacteria bacterium]